MWRWWSGLLIRHDSKSCNRYTAVLLVMNLAQLDWPRWEGFSCKRIEEHKQEGLHVQSEIADLYEMKIKRGSSSDHKRTKRRSGEEQKRGPWFTAKWLVITITMKKTVSYWKTWSKQNSNPRDVVAAVNQDPRDVEDPLDMPLLGSNMINGPSA